MFLLFCMVLFIGCESYLQKQQENTQSNTFSVKELVDTIEIEKTEYKKDEELEAIVQKNTAILGIDVKHENRLVLVTLVFNPSISKEEIERLLVDCSNEVKGIYGESVIHIQGIQNGQNIANLIKDLTK